MKHKTIRPQTLSDVNGHWVNVLVIIAALCTLVGPMAAARTVEFETSEVT
ncbi:MAG: hypothetical protein ACYS9C_10810 [Planctomycetota bacterium]|jgi:hypothetical protein